MRPPTKRVFHIGLFAIFLLIAGAVQPASAHPMQPVDENHKSPTYMSEPTPAANSSKDADDDGLSNKQERELGTNPRQADSDRDGLSDGREVEIGTNPTRPDTDRDGLVDSRELKVGTDPTRVDTDGDTWTDKEEVEAGTDPLSADSVPADSNSPGTSERIRNSSAGQIGGNEDFSISVGDFQISMTQSTLLMLLIVIGLCTILLGMLIRIIIKRAIRIYRQYQSPVIISHE